MKIGYLILAHKDPDFVVRLINRLTADTENHCFIHVDAKTDCFEKAINDCISDRIHWLENRIPVYWGGYNSIVATISLLEESVQYKLDRYVILQGADYPLYSNAYINSFFKSHEAVEFINAIDESLGSKSEWYRYVPKNYLDKPNILKRIKNKINAQYWRSNLPKYINKCVVCYGGEEHHIYRGWAHFAITLECAEFIVKFSKENDEFNNYFKFVYAPDESYFHTIVYNSMFREKTVLGGPIAEESRNLKSLLNLTYFEYPSEVREFKNIEEYDYLKETGYLFFRKASSASKELLDYIDSRGN